MQLYIRVHTIILKWNLILSIWIFFFNKILSLDPPIKKSFEN